MASVVCIDGRISPEKVKEIAGNVKDCLYCANEAIVKGGFRGFLARDKHFGNKIRDELYIQAAQEMERVCQAELCGNVRYIKKIDLDGWGKSVIAQASNAGLMRKVIADLQKAYGIYEKQFLAIPEMTLEARENLGLRKINLTISIAAANKLGLYKEGEGAKLLRELEAGDGVGNPTMYCLLPVEVRSDELESDRAVIEDLHNRLKQAILVRTGWISTPDVLQNRLTSRLCSLNNAKCSWGDAVDYVANRRSGGKKRIAMFGLAGLGYIDSLGRGMPLIHPVPKYYDYSVRHKRKLARKISCAHGIRSGKVVGHSEGGLEASYVFEEDGSFGHCLNQAGLSGITRHDARREAFLMGMLAVSNALKLTAQGSKALADIEIRALRSNEKQPGASIIGWVVGDGLFDRRMMIDDHSDIYGATAKQAFQAISKAMRLMVEGQGPGFEQAVILNKMLRMPRYLGHTFNVSMKDFFVRRDALFARACTLYDDILQVFGWDFGLATDLETQVGHKVMRLPTRLTVPFSDEDLVATKTDPHQKLYEALFRWQNLACPGTDETGHYQFLDERALETLIEQMLERSEKWEFDRWDFLLCAAARCLPVAIRPTLKKEEETQLADTLWRKALTNFPTEVVVSMERYEKIRWLLEINGEKQKSFKQRFHERLPDIARVLPMEQTMAGIKAIAWPKIKDTQEVEQVVDNLIWRQLNFNQKELEGMEAFARFWKTCTEPVKGLRRIGRRSDRLNKNTKRLGLECGLQALTTAHKRSLGKSPVLDPAERMRISEFVSGLSDREIDRSINDGGEKVGGSVFRKYFLEFYGDEVIGQMPEVAEVEKVARDTLIAQFDPYLDYNNEQVRRAYNKACQTVDNRLANNIVFRQLDVSARGMIYDQILNIIQHQFEFSPN